MFKSLTKSGRSKSLSDALSQVDSSPPVSKATSLKGGLDRKESDASSHAKDSKDSSVGGPVGQVQPIEGRVQEGCPCEVLDTIEKKLNHWINGGYWICVTLKEARSLGAYDYDTQSSDPFAKLRLTLPGEKAPVISEHRTRTVHRNLSPMFEERLLCPLSGLSPACMFHLSLYDADWLRAEFMGQVKQSLGQLLEAIEDVNKPSQPRWYSLMGKSNKPKNSCEGEVLLQVELMSYTQAEQHRRNQDKFKRPEFLEARFNDTQLELGAQSLLFSHRVRDAKAIEDFLGKASIEVRVGQSMIRQPIRPKVKEGLKGEQKLELELDDKIIIPLHDAFQGNIMVFDKKASSEIADIKIYICVGSEQMYKTQVPLWAVPVQNEEVSESEDDEGSSPVPSSSKSVSNVPLGKASSTPVKGLSRSSAANLDKAESTPSFTASGNKAEPLSVSEARTKSVVWKGLPRSQAEVGLLVASDLVHTTSFSRNMEHYSARQTTLPSCQLGFSLNIVPRQVATPGPSGDGENCGCTVLDVCEDQEDERDAPPLKNVPAPLESKVLEANFPCGPCKLYQLLFKAGSELIDQIAKREGLTKMDIGPWGLSNCVDGKQARQRTWKYTKPLNIPIPFSPKIADVTEVHTLQIKEVSGWLLEIVITTDAPKGDTFKVVNQVLCMRGTSAGSCSLRVTMTVEFLKNVGFLKGAIQGGALKDTVKHWGEEVSAVLRASLAGSSPDAAAEDNKDTEVAALPSSAAPAPKHSFAPLLLPGLMALGALLVVGLLFTLAYTGWQSLLRVQQSMVEAMELLVKAQEQLVSLQAARAGEQCTQGSLQ